MKLFDPKNPHYKRNMAFGVKHSNSGLYLNRTKAELKDGFERAIRRVPSKYKTSLDKVNATGGAPQKPSQHHFDA